MRINQLFGVYVKRVPISDLLTSATHLRSNIITCISAALHQGRVVPMRG